MQSDSADVTDTRPTAAAFYLPQYHPVPENDAWWGAGFTEWRNVVQARPRFRGHYQPHLPADLGFYDLRSPETRAAQAELAASAGIGAFCYYHYWSAGRRLLERPFDDVVASSSPALPFFLCWANEDWTRTWDGRSGETLWSQEYSPADDVAHLQALAPALGDSRYLRVQGAAVFVVYRPSRLPDPPSTCDRWRREADRLGVGPLHLIAVQRGDGDDVDPSILGFDAAADFQPQGRDVPRIPRAKLGGRVLSPQAGYRRNDVRDYASLVRAALAQAPVPYRRYGCVTPSWDNSARRASGAFILRGSTPELFQGWLGGAMSAARVRGDSLLFINAWNEWAEGNHLEPDARWGRGYLHAAQAILKA